MSLRTSLPITAVLDSDFFAYLTERLNSLVAVGKIRFWGYIQHKAEYDRVDKDHVHLYLIPTGLIDTSCLSHIASGFSKCRSFKDWYLYNLHFEPYMDAKYLVSYHQYSDSDFVWSDPLVANGMIYRYIVKNERE